MVMRIADVGHRTLLTSWSSREASSNRRRQLTSGRCRRAPPTAVRFPVAQAGKEHTMRWSHLSLRISTGAHILNSGLEKRPKSSECAPEQFVGYAPAANA